MPGDFVQTGPSLISRLTQKAMKLLAAGQRKKALRLQEDCLTFLRSFTPTEEMLRLQATLLNNLGCFHKDNHEPYQALKYLQEALKLEKILAVTDVRMASTCINICVAYSLTGRHDKALTSGLDALKILENSAEDDPHLEPTLVLALHNVAVEYEHLKNLRMALHYYTKAWSHQTRLTPVMTRHISLAIHRIAAKLKTEKPRRKRSIFSTTRNRMKPPLLRRLSIADGLSSVYTPRSKHRSSTTLIITTPR